VTCPKSAETDNQGVTELFSSAVCKGTEKVQRNQKEIRKENPVFALANEISCFNSTGNKQIY